MSVIDKLAKYLHAAYCDTTTCRSWAKDRDNAQRLAHLLDSARNDHQRAAAFQRDAERAAHPAGSNRTEPTPPTELDNERRRIADNAAYADTVRELAAYRNRNQQLETDPTRHNPTKGTN